MNLRGLPDDPEPSPGASPAASGRGRANASPRSGELFSRDELRMLEDTRPFRVREKVMDALERSFEQLRVQLSSHLERGTYLAPPGVDFAKGKFGQGEHLDGLPYFFVDLPRYVGSEDCFTYRALFWWGDAISFSLILGGSHLGVYRRRLLENLEILSALEVYVSLADNPWDWQRGRGRTVLARPGAEDELLRVFRRQSHLKCSRFLEFGDPEFRENRIDEAGLYTFRALEPLVLM